MNYITEFDLYIHIVYTVYMFCAKIDWVDSGDPKEAQQTHQQINK